MLVSEGVAGETLDHPDNEQGDIAIDAVLAVGAQVADRFPPFAAAGLASSWTGVYDVTPDWNPVLGRLPDVPGLVVAYGFSGHGFKLSPAVGEMMAARITGARPPVDPAPFAFGRFSAKGPSGTFVASYLG
jgi:sarcosine oxidase subunit beta